MTVQLVERIFPGEMATADAAALDIKPDVHTRRVLQRLGQADEDTDDTAVAAARRMHSANPGRIDGPLWYVGHVWCHAKAPDCSACFLADLCASART
jgi:endonuclease III